MNRVQLLSEDVIKKIAAGEVVERPASVVKELVENALDAGSRRIVVDLEDGGKKRITISDDGCGIPPDDCLLALRRHATSKITHQDDLFDIHTLGFRGEALAAISSIADFSLSTRVRGASIGCKVTVEGDEPSVIPWSGADGTTVTVANLFCKVPVREKFLKSPETEFAQSHDLIQALALAFPNVGFSLIHNGKQKFSAPALDISKDGDWRGESALRARWALVAGKEEAQVALYVREENQYGRWEALISAPGHDKATNKHLIHFVNGRWVKDKVLNFGVLRGYHSHLMRGRHPQVLSFFECEPSLIDVNVHPAKTELRFQYPSEVQGLMSFGIRRALRAAEWSESGPGEAYVIPSDSSVSPSERVIPSEHGVIPSVRPVIPSVSPVIPSAVEGSPLSASVDRSFRQTDAFSYAKAPSRWSPRTDNFNRSTKVLTGDPSHAFGMTGTAFGMTGPSASAKAIADELANKPLGTVSGITEDLTYLGTFAKCYVLFEKDEKLLAIDQHAFHERILYERLCAYPQMLSQRQVLMMPEAITIDQRLSAALKEHANTVQAAGFELAFLEDTTVEVRAVPTLLVNKPYDAFLMEFAEKLADGSIASAQQIHHDILATLACHAAVRAGEELTESELKLLLREAQTVDFFHNCPHGRPVFKWFAKSQVAAWFDR